MTSLLPLRLLRAPSAPAHAARLLSSTARAAAAPEGGPAETYRAFRRRNESDETLRARLLYQSRYRGTLESDLLLSTFATAHLPSMSRPQLEAYDAFLLEEDWDIYYWATQDHPTAPSPAPAETRAPPPEPANSTADQFARQPAEGEWGTIAGNVRAGYRGVPDRWRESEVLRLLREHVRERSVGDGKGGMAARPKLFGEGTEKD